MTWVIGSASPFGYSALVSDVQVRLTDGSRLDALRKVYLVGQVIGLGFAGSIKIAFDLIDDLTPRLALTREQAAASSWDPVKVARWWMPEAARIFRDAPPAETKLGCHILLVGTSPTVDLGNGPYAARPYVVRLVAPDFRPMIMRAGYGAWHIGTGSRVNVYKRHIRDRFREPKLHVRSAFAGPAAWGAMLAHDIGLTIEEHSDQGISPHLHVLLCGRHWASLQKNDGGRFTRHGYVEFTMPRVASSYQEFQDLCQQRSVKAGGAFA